MRQFQINESHSVSGRRESDPHQRLGKPLYYHCTTTAKIFISLLLRRIGFKHHEAVGTIRINGP